MKGYRVLGAGCWERSHTAFGGSRLFICFILSILVFQTALAYPRGASGIAAPVTVAEVDATILEIRKALSVLPGLEALKKTGDKAATSIGSSPATRAYIILKLDRLFERARPTFRFTPRRVRFDARVLKVGKAERPALEKLIAWGCVARVGPLATGPGATIGLKEFGDAIGFFVARLADLTHTPDPKYSPGMMGGGS